MYKQIAGLILTATLVLGNIPTAYAAVREPVTEEYEEEIVIEDSSEPEEQDTPVVEEITEQDELSSEESTDQSSETESDNYGLIPNEFEAEPLEDAAISRVRSAIPSSYDSRSNGYVTAARNQNSYGTCWAFGALAAAEGSILSKGLESESSLDLAERHLLYFFYNSVTDPLGNTAGDKTENISGQDDLQVGGNGLFTTFALANWVGAASEDQVPYQYLVDNYSIYKNSPGTFFQNAALDSSLAYSDTYHLQNARWISMSNDNYVKQAIMDYGAVGVSYYDASKYYNSSTQAYYNNMEKSVNHMVALVGWDDNYDKSNFQSSPEHNGAWLVKNSWGYSWGDAGFFWISYEDWGLTKGGNSGSPTTAFVYDFESGDNYQNNYQYDGSHGAGYNYINSGGSIANVFQVKANDSGSETLEAVSFALNSTNVNYSIQIYRNLTNTANPTSGTPTLATPVTGSTDFQGYYTVPLGTSVPLAEGTSYSIVITLTRSNSSVISYMVDTTYQNSNWITFTSNVQLNQSFEKDSSSGSWADLVGNMDQSGNAFSVARIKGFTDNSAKRYLSKINLSSSNLYINKGGTATLSCLVTPSNADNTSVSYAPSNSGVAAVDSNGKVTAVGYGTAVITAKARDDGGVSTTCNVTVPYAISYVLNGGKNDSSNPTTYYNTKITLKNPSRAKYAFKGWFTDKACTKQIKTITAGTSGNLTLYAKWKKVSVKKVNLTKVKKTGARKVRTYYKKVSGAAGYQITYSTSKKFTKKTTKYAQTQKVARTLTKLKKGKTYYVKVRAYKLDSAGKKVYGKYSKVLRIKL